MVEQLKSQDRMLVQRCGQGPVSYSYEPNDRGKVKLVRSTISESQRKHLHRLALAGLLAEKVDGCGGIGEPPSTTVTFSITAKGREEIGMRCPVQPPTRLWIPPTEAQMEREGLA